MKVICISARRVRLVASALLALVLLGTICGTVFATEPFPPTKIYQKDGVWRVDYLSGSPLEFYAEGDHLPRFRFQFEFDIPREEFEKYVFKTSAGPDWAQRAIHYFVKIADKPHFCARTWWGRRILVNLADFKHVPDTPHEQVLRAKEQRWILERLAGATKHMPAGNNAAERREIERILTAVYHTGRMQIAEAIPLLKQLEPSEYIGSGGGIMGERGLREGDIHALRCRVYTLRQMVQRTLRGLGENPREELPATQLHYLTPERFGDMAQLYAGDPYKPRKFSTSRHERVSKLRAGMKPDEVLDTLGPPDELVTHRDQWRYDIDVTRPYSLLVTWRDYQIVSKIEKLRPPLWLKTERFDEHAKPVNWSAPGD